VAVLLVVLDHSGVAFLSSGFIGVDVFFVISGYVITGLLLRECSATGRIRLLPFYSRRIRRIFPAALFVIVVTVVAERLLTGAVAASH
jgi:peptidoglycan/LPS O-acetylase OafA/YrhL